MGEFRLAKLGEQIRGEIALLISTQKIKDPRVSTFLTINRVEVAADLAYAKVYVSSFLPEGQILKGVAGLNSAAGFIQSSIAKKLTIRKFPKLSFIADRSVKEGFEMANKLNRLEAEETEIRRQQTDGQQRKLRNFAFKQAVRRNEFCFFIGSKKISWHKKSRSYGNIGFLCRRTSCRSYRTFDASGFSYYEFWKNLPCID